ncbi:MULTISPECIES: winged helix-turn-helix transcriptional regulator [Protofrankia]|uniref:Transcriptional regulator, HxlR family n=1 Tax=Candidatus Protofrankia datiscae TaxID=2716812 RepID=F8AZS2_9ACTN|nr:MULTISPECIES: helix-turn-helix domain-containing protein [Protofrankia]AEH09683.1 transcriptional regulator, HxlR family [Candidatus Protofrankia datiscae]
MSRSHTHVPGEVIEQACPLVEVLDHVAGKWSISILVAAARGPVRFTELERAIEGISRRMLTLNLRRLERDGLLTRTVYPTVPPKVEYSLTAMAQELYSYLTGLVEWAERHSGAIAHARAAYDTAAAPADPPRSQPERGRAQVPASSP